MKAQQHQELLELGAVVKEGHWYFKGVVLATEQETFEALQRLKEVS